MLNMRSVGFLCMMYFLLHKVKTNMKMAIPINTSVEKNEDEPFGICRDAGRS